MSEAIASKEERLVAYNANIAAADKDPSLSPETGKPLSKVNTIRFGAGFLVFGILWMSGLGIVSAVLLPMHYKTIEGADPDALVGIVAVIILPKERSADFLPKEEGSFKDILVSFRPPKFAGAHDFYKAFAGRFCMLMSYQMINVYQLYIIQNYIGQSVKESAVTVSVVSMIMMVMSLVGSFISGPVSDLIGRRKVPVVVASVLFAIGIAMPWLIPSTLGMYLFAGIAGLGYAVYYAVDQALLVDVLPNKEEAGKDLGILNMGTTLGQMCGPVVMSTIVVSLGYNFAFPTAIALAIIGCFFIMAIKKVK